MDRDNFYISRKPMKNWTSTKNLESIAACMQTQWCVMYSYVKSVTIYLIDLRLYGTIIALSTCRPRRNLSHVGIDATAQDFKFEYLRNHKSYRSDFLTGYYWELLGPKAKLSLL